ncbi:MAG: hypothetical protein NC417_04275 [Candidatus Gastranaerophilales bacterium]|nr:hypothetical protein [Candidatus Gastranaerophilales bacterium]
MTDSEKLDLILDKVNSVDTRVSNLESDLQEVKKRVTNTDLILENEIRVNIQRVAEGHLDLSRNLHDAMRPSNEVEMLAIKVRMLETDIRDLKAKMA